MCCWGTCLQSLGGSWRAGEGVEVISARKPVLRPPRCQVPQETFCNIVSCPPDGGYFVALCRRGWGWGWGNEAPRGCDCPSTPLLWESWDLQNRSPSLCSMRFQPFLGQPSASTYHFFGSLPFPFEHKMNHSLTATLGCVDNPGFDLGQGPVISEGPSRAQLPCARRLGHRVDSCHCLHFSTQTRRLNTRTSASRSLERWESFVSR